MVTTPTVSLKNLNQTIKSLASTNNFDVIETAATSAQSKFTALQSTKVGLTVGKIDGGWKALTQENDGLVEADTTVVNKGVALLEENPQGVNLTNDFASGSSDALKTITGLSDDIKIGINSTVLAMPTPEAIASALQQQSGLALDKLSSAMESVAPNATKALSSSSVINQFASTVDGLPSGIFKDLETSTNNITSGLTKFFDQGFNQSIKDIIGATIDPIGYAIGQLTQDTGIIVPNETRKQVSALLDKKDYLTAANLLNGYSNLTAIQIETELSNIDTSVGSLVDQLNSVYANLGISTAPVYTIGSQNGEWQGASTVIKSPASNKKGYSFSIVSSLDELEAELSNCTREITETVIHWTGNFIDQPHIGAEDIHQWHTGTGFSGLGYHYIIKRDGTIQRGRPLNIEGAHANDFGHNQYSIGIAHVAGYNCLSGTDNPESFLSSESITVAQMKAQKDFLRIFYKVFQSGQVLGHNQCTENNDIDPGFDVDAYILNTFSKSNAVQYNNNLGPLSRSALITARQN